MSAIAVIFECTVVSHAKKSTLRLGLGKGISAYACRSVFFIVPETSGASIKVLEDNEGVKALINNAPELS